MLRKLFFSLAYYRNPIWDTGISPPELLNFINTHPPGSALDLGCGTGTNVITLAKSGWRATGVDFASHALKIAKKKARSEGVNVTLLRDDVTLLESIHESFDLILDIGCYHSLPPSHHRKYIQNLLRLLAPEGTYLLYIFLKPSEKEFGPGVTEKHLLLLQQNLRLISRKDGSERGIRPSAWLEFRRIRQ
jgi:cyclopropane fatty-acyl-phospholipid synthase-like methyltransferase